MVDLGVTNRVLIIEAIFAPFYSFEVNSLFDDKKCKYSVSDSLESQILEY